MARLHGKAIKAGTVLNRKATKIPRRGKNNLAPENAPLPKKRVEKYLSITEKALSQLKHASPMNTHNMRIADDFLTMAVAYYSDACHFFEKGNLVDAFACVNYAHGWLDAGARLGLWDTGGSELFTV